MKERGCKWIRMLRSGALSQTRPTTAGGRDDVPGVPNISAAAWIHVQLRRAEPDAPYRRSDVYPIKIFCRNFSYPLKKAKTRQKDFQLKDVINLTCTPSTPQGSDQNDTACRLS